MSTPDPRIRHFIALDPPQPVRAGLAHCELAPGDEQAWRVDPADWHMTLVFLGKGYTAEAILAAVGRVVAASPGFELRLEVAGHWRHGGIAWMGLPDRPVPLITLQAALVEALRPLGHQPGHLPFRPHVTLARRAASPPIPGGIPIWPVREVALMRGVEPMPDNGPRYERLRTLPLAAPRRLDGV
ncbi:2'-5' RNA ligase family protein [Spiribacter insolitus]|uniref:RNA 2',3'-cyclic phosphodiesterase n=1 Tax=Spiribacter insolitus TaxID=3122417 RepID=A0ABV3T7I5_9GAMM